MVPKNHASATGSGRQAAEPLSLFTARNSKSAKIPGVHARARRGRGELFENYGTPRVCASACAGIPLELRFPGLFLRDGHLQQSPDRTRHPGGRRRAPALRGPAPRSRQHLHLPPDQRRAAAKRLRAGARQGRGRRQRAKQTGKKPRKLAPKPPKEGPGPRIRSISPTRRASQARQAPGGLSSGWGLRLPPEQPVPLRRA